MSLDEQLRDISQRLIDLSKQYPQLDFIFSHTITNRNDQDYFFWRITEPASFVKFNKGFEAIKQHNIEKTLSYQRSLFVVSYLGDDQFYDELLVKGRSYFVLSFYRDERTKECYYIELIDSVTGFIHYTDEDEDGIEGFSSKSFEIVNLQSNSN